MGNDENNNSLLEKYEIGVFYAGEGNMTFIMALN